MKNDHVYLLAENARPESRITSPLGAVAVDVMGTQTSEEVMRKAKLDWAVVKTPLKLEDGAPVDSHVAIVRNDTKSILGVVGSGYEPLQNAEAFSFTDTLVEMGAVEYVGAGSFDGGSRIFIQAKVNRDDGNGLGVAEIVPGDTMEPFFFFANGHDGSLSLHSSLVNQRTVCRNTFAIAIGQAKRNQNSITIRHTKNIVERLEKSKELLAWAGSNFHKLVVAARDLTKKNMDIAKLEALFAEAFKLQAPEGKETLGTRSENKLGRLMALFETGEGNDIPGVRGTAWAAVNAVTQYLTHESTSVLRGTSGLNESARAAQIAAKRYESNILGNNRLIAERAFQAALAI